MDENDSKKAINTYMAMGISLGIAFGAVLGLLLYVMLWNIILLPAGIIFGTTVGLVAGNAYGRRKVNQAPPPPDSKQKK